MRSTVTRFTLVLAMLGSTTLFVAGQRVAEIPLTNTAVVKLVRAGFKEKTVIAIIRSRRNSFNLEPDKLIELKRNGVTENIILAMLAQDDSFVFSDDDWSNDSDFGRSNKAGGVNPSGQDGGTDIFGGRQGSNSQSRSRGLNGS
ncbi:MAG TPA: hypothetical protein VMS31_17380, partial [Pyrinomonadaceae bacterium]|nr:hypothetical protein [Pyrinomonadaceae bacterium]